MWLHLENKIYTVKTQVLTPKPNINLHHISQSLIRTRSTIQKLHHKKHVMDQHQDA